MLSVDKLKKALKHDRFDYVSALLRSGWFTDGTMLVKLPSKELKRIGKLQAPTPALIPELCKQTPDIERSLQNYSRFSWKPATIVQEVQYPIKNAPSGINSTSNGLEWFIEFDKCVAPYVRAKIEYITSLYEGVQWFRIVSSKANPVQARVDNEVIGMVHAYIIPKEAKPNARKNTRHR